MRSIKAVGLPIDGDYMYMASYDLTPQVYKKPNQFIPSNLCIQTSKITGRALIITKREQEAERCYKS
jgi:hypothetical protein